MAVLVALSAFTACGADDPEPGTSSSEELYRRHCAACHANDGSGASGPAVDSAALAGASQDEVVAVIAEGEGAMPGFSDRLTAEEIEELATYLRTELGADADGS